MSEIDTQASQRTVVAFITGLLIGGLLVWVFGASPEDAKKGDEGMDVNVASVETNTASDEKKADATTGETTTRGDGAIKAGTQAAGMSVILDSVEYPADKGWVVVREYAEDMPGNILGAARYDVAAGLMPTMVSLQRGTVAGGTYQVLFYTNEGDLGFDLASDTAVAGISAMFTAN